MRRLAPLLAAAATAQAAPPLNTDDAGILPAGACQLEVRVRPGQQVQQQYAQPSCNFGGDVEWALNLTRVRSDETGEHDLLSVQGKTVLKPLESSGWGAAVSAGLTQEVRRASHGTLAFATLIASAALSDAWTVHANAGATQLRSHHAIANWGGAVEYALNDTWTLLAERYGERHGRPATQIGARMWVRPNLQLDATIGHERAFGRGERYGTIGLLWVWKEAK